MLKTKLFYLPLGTLTAVTLVSGAVLMSAGAHADTVIECSTSNGETTCKGSGAPQVKTDTANTATNGMTRTAKVTVSAACTMTGSDYSKTFSGAISGSTVNTIDDSSKPDISVSCNNPSGFKIKAVGSSDKVTVSGTDYTNYMVGTSGVNIETATRTTGASAWAFRVTSASAEGGTGTIPTAYQSQAWNAVPNSATEIYGVASLTSGTAKATVRTDYQVYISNTQAAGTYTGKVTYTLVPNGSAS